MQAGAVEDAVLIEASRRGDRNAFARIIERYQRAVYAVSFSSSRDRALSDDITQDTFVTAWRRLGDLRDATRLPAWLCGIARNVARDAHKRRKREHAGDAPTLVAPGTPFDSLCDAEADQLIATALAKVPETYREPLVLFYYEQHSVDDVARILGISVAATHKRIARGRRCLADGVTAIVERGLARRGPKGELVAGVLAAIGALTSASHVDASPAAKGSTMTSKLTFVAIVTLTVGAAGVISAEVVRDPSKPSPSRAATSAKPRKPTPVKTAPAAKPATPAPHATKPAGAATAVPRLAAAGAAPIAVPDCDAVAVHMRDLRLARLEQDGPLPAKKRALFGEAFLTNTANHCRDDGWSENVRLCIVDANDYERAKFDCTDAPVATAAEVAALPPDLRCDALAEHVFKLATGPDGKFTIVKQKLKSAEKIAQLDRLIAGVRTEMARECEEMPWSVERRRCYAASKTHRATGACK